MEVAMGYVPVALVDSTSDDHPQHSHEDLEPFPPLPEEANEEVEGWWRAASSARHLRNRSNRTVRISPIPEDVTASDILPRIRGGVESCLISQFQNNRTAVVTFKRHDDAVRYVEFCAKPWVWRLWTFRVSRDGSSIAWEQRAKVEISQPPPGVARYLHGAGIPLRKEILQPPPDYNPKADCRCIKFEGRKPDDVPFIYRALGFPISQHQRDQVESMWFDGLVREYRGDPIYGDLHIWFTSIKAAHEAEDRWAPYVMAHGELTYEPDPCSEPVESLVLRPDEVEGNGVAIARHYEPYINLIELNYTILSGALRGILDLAEAQPHLPTRAPASQILSGPPNLNARLQYSLQSHFGGTSPPYQPPGT
jgi:hypothetical protein